ncbi:MAG: substrate-binding domain-containing protein [Lachnospiraceae bacterium]|nr:substrate-binding domain-containing protein [Lachnospiraceae bacterium]
MKKKALAVLLATGMVFSLAACSSGATTTKSTSTKATSDADVNGDGKVIVGYISKNLTDPFHAPINDHATTTLDKMVKDKVIDEWTGILDGETDPNKQIDRADECITKACDIVIMLPAEAEASDPAVTKLNDAGIKVIVVNSKTTSTDDVAIAYCGSDDVLAGEMLGQWVVDNVKDGGKYIHCQGILGNSAQIQRGEGIANIMGKNSQFTLAGEFDTQWSGDKAANAATDAIAQYGKELVAVICDNDDMSSAAQRACNDAGRSDIVCVGVDGNQNPLQMVKDGEMGATVLQDGVGQIQAAIDVITALVNGDTFEKNPSIPFVLVTKDNVDDYLK